MSSLARSFAERIACPNITSPRNERQQQLRAYVVLVAENTVNNDIVYIIRMHRLKNKKIKYGSIDIVWGLFVACFWNCSYTFFYCNYLVSVDPTLFVQFISLCFFNRTLRFTVSRPMTTTWRRASDLRFGFVVARLLLSPSDSSDHGVIARRSLGLAASGQTVRAASSRRQRLLLLYAATANDAIKTKTDLALQQRRIGKDGGAVHVEKATAISPFFFFFVFRCFCFTGFPGDCGRVLLLVRPFRRGLHVPVGLLYGGGARAVPRRRSSSSSSRFSGGTTTRRRRRRR